MEGGCKARRIVKISKSSLTVMLQQKLHGVILMFKVKCYIMTSQLTQRLTEVLFSATHVPEQLQTSGTCFKFWILYKHQ